MNKLNGLGFNAFKKRSGLTNEFLASLLECSPGLIYQYSTGKSGISLDKLEICFQFGMLLDEAFSPETCEAIRETEKSLQDKGTPTIGETKTLQAEIERLKELVGKQDAELRVQRGDLLYQDNQIKQTTKLLEVLTDRIIKLTEVLKKNGLEDSV